MRLREKTTATLLIAVFMISIFAVAMPVSAQTTWTVPGNFATIQEAIDSDDVQEGDTILVGEGEWYGGDIDKALIIKGLHGAVIVDGPAYPHRVGEPDGPAHIGFFIEPEGSGCTVESFTFRGGRIGDTENYLDLAVFGRYVSDVTVKSNKILNCSQCISNNFGSNWIITHNIIECVYHWHLLGIYLNGSYGNIISHNEITGEAPVRGQGIEFVNGCYNEIVSNTITITGPDAVAIKLRVSGISEDPTPEEIAYAQSVLHDYAIQYNDLRGSTNQFSITPPELEEVNTIDVSTAVYERQLYEGWNLISLPRIPEDPSITVMLYDIIDYVESVWTYNAATGLWLSYSPGAPSDLTKMVDGKGYWISMSASATLTVNGTEMPEDPFDPLPAYQVVEGWNLVGFKSTSTMTVSEYLLGVEYVRVYEYVDGYHVLTANDNMVPGRGYWVAVSEPGTIYP